MLRGQKAFSSGANHADYGWIAARTDPTAPKHRGISLFIVDMTSPGISITASRTIGGWLHHAVYFGDVEVPRGRLVGELNAGWRMIMGAIDTERAALAGPGATEAALDALVAAARAPRLNRLDPPLFDSRTVQNDLVLLAIESEVARLSAHWLEALRIDGAEPTYETSLALLFKRETLRAVESSALDILAERGPVAAEQPDAMLDGQFTQEYRDHLYYHFAAGGFDITRNVVANRGLGLPRQEATGG